MSRSYPKVFFEMVCQVTLIDETGHRRHDGWYRTVSQKLARPLDTHLDQILVRRQPGRFAKCTNDAKGGYSGPLSKHVERCLVGPGVGILEHIAYDAHDPRLAGGSAPPVQRLILGAPVRVATYQFRDRNADGLLSRPFIEIRGFGFTRSVSTTKSTGGAPGGSL